MQNIKDQLNTIVKLFNNGEKEIALNIINLLLPSNEKNIELLFLHAKICINLNEINKANSSLEKILNLESNNYEALKLIYLNCLKNNKIDLAKKYIDKLLTIKKNSYEFLRDKAYIEYLNNDYLVSEKYINEALNQNSEEVFGLNILGLLFVKKDQTLNAINVFKKAILINPQYSDSYNKLSKKNADLILCPTSIGSAYNGKKCISLSNEKEKWKNVIAANSLMINTPIVIINRIGNEYSNSKRINFWGSSFITDANGDISYMADNKKNIHKYTINLMSKKKCQKLWGFT